MKSRLFMYIPLLILTVIIIGLFVIFYFEKKRIDMALMDIYEKIHIQNQSLQYQTPPALPQSLDTQDSKSEPLPVESKETLRNEIEEYEKELQFLDEQIETIQLKESVSCNEDTTIVKHDDIIENDISDTDLSDKDLSDKDISDKDLSDKDILDKNISDMDMINTEMIDDTIPTEISEEDSEIIIDTDEEYEDEQAIQTDEDEVIQTDEDEVIQTDEEEKDTGNNTITKHLQDLIKDNNNIDLESYKNKFNLQDLKKICKEHKLIVKGNKTDLLMRIYHFNNDLLK